MVPYGAGGYLSTYMTFKPEIAWRYWNALQAGNLEAARAVIRDYDMPLFDYLIASEGSFDAAIHGILELFGFAKRYRPRHVIDNRRLYLVTIVASFTGQPSAGDAGLVRLNCPAYAQARRVGRLKAGQRTVRQAMQRTCLQGRRTG